VYAAIGYAELPWQGNFLIALWLWCLGANVGSFMNVVIYRVPAGRSVVAPRSRCPACGNGIAWYDNIPVLSWMILRARCRNCGVKISSRYPTIEAIIAVMFLIVAFLSPITNGANLPQSVIAPPLRLNTMSTLWIMYGCHMLLLCTLASAAMIRYDRHAAPWRLFSPVMAAGLVLPLIWPQLRPVPFRAPVHLNQTAIALLDSFAGLAAGTTLALIAWAFWQQRRGKHEWKIGELLAGASVGLVLGWQAAAVVIPVSVAGHLITLRLGRWQERFLRWSWAGHLWWSTIVYLVLWATLVDLGPWLGVDANIVTYAVSAALTALLTWLAVGVDTAIGATATIESTAKTATAFTPSLAQPTEEYRMPNDEAPDPQQIVNSPSYRLAELDTEFLQRDSMRPVRVQLELLKPEMLLTEQGVQSTIVVFGGTQVVDRQEAERRLEDVQQALAGAPSDPQLHRKLARAERVLAKANYYDAARDFGRMVSSACQVDGRCDYVIITGGGPGVMEAANRGAHDVNAKSAGLNITLPEEQAPNPYITPELCFQFHYFALRKMHFLLRAKALVVFPGGFGTLDELFDALTLLQTQRMPSIPVILYGREYWNRVIDFQFLADEGVVRDEHLELVSYADTPHEAWDVIARFHGL
jgi:hypothetical protein